MILVDTSVWVDHFRRGTPLLARALESSDVLMHPFVLGEIACGNLSNRSEILRLLGDLPLAPVAADVEVLAFIESHALMGRGIGYVDVHLLASIVLAGNAQVWTRDRRLAAVASDIGVSYPGR
jgi:predicted nucleic acid-binding protein